MVDSIDSGYLLDIVYVLKFMLIDLLLAVFGFNGLKLFLWFLVVGIQGGGAAIMMVVYGQQNLEGWCRK